MAGKPQKVKKVKKLLRSARRKGGGDTWQDKVRYREEKARRRRDGE